MRRVCPDVIYEYFLYSSRFEEVRDPDDPKQKPDNIEDDIISKVHSIYSHGNCGGCDQSH
nr:hypothetical protein 4 [Desulfobacterales bacterium]